MSETRETRSPGSPAPRDGPEPKTEYQPPAIAWEEPLEAVAESFCALFSGDPGCGSQLQQ